MERTPIDGPGRGSRLPRIGRDLAYAARRLKQRPGFALIAILSLALGIGANTAIFSLVNAVILRELPLEAPEDLVNVYVATPDIPYGVFSYPDLEDLREGTDEVFEELGASKLTLVQVDRAGSVEMVPGELVTGNLFPLLGVDAEIGRTILPEDDRSPGGHPVCVLSHRFWQSEFDGDPGIVGQQVRLSGRPYTVLGVAPEPFTGNLRGLEPAVFVPMMMANELVGGTEDVLQARGSHSLFAKARLKPGVTLPQVQVAMDAVSHRLTEAETGGWDPQTTFVPVPTTSVILYPPFDRFARAAAWLLMVVVGLVLLIACLNLASFLLAQALDRRKEMALRLALGASRRDLIGQLLTETVLLAIVAGTAGVAVSYWLLDLLVEADLPLPLPVTLDLGPDPVVLGFTLAVSVVAGLLLGLVPALQSTRPDVASTLKDESAGGGAPGKLALGQLLVAAQVAVSLVLLVGAGLFLRSLYQVQTVDPGFGRQPAAVMTVMAPAVRYTEDQGRQFVRRLLDQFERVPGVEAVGMIDNLHLNTTNTQSIGFNVDGHEPPPEREVHIADRATANAGFFEAVGIQILRGRNFDERDVADAPRVVIVNQALAERFWSSAEAALGQVLHQDNGQDLQVVGVASNAKIRSLGEAPRPFVYLPYSQDYSAFLTFVARTTREPDRLALALLAAGREVDADLWVWEAKTMADHLGIMLLPARLSALLLAVFAALALGLSCVGLYGIVSYAVSKRTREVGIRMSLGADARAVIFMLMRGGLRPVAVGAVVGLVLAFALSQLLSGLLFGVHALDPLTFLAVPAVLGTAAALAAFLPARRASRIEAVTALRTE